MFQCNLGAVCKKRPNKKSSDDNYDKNGIDVHLNSRKGNKKSGKGDFSVAGSRVQTMASSASCNKFQLIIAFVSILFMRVSLLWWLTRKACHSIVNRFMRTLSFICCVFSTKNNRAKEFVCLVYSEGEHGFRSLYMWDSKFFCPFSDVGRAIYSKGNFR